MCIPENKLVIKKSTLPGAGKGLFTRMDIPRKTRIVEYSGSVSKWSELGEDEVDNGYLYYINRNHVINARPFLKALGRYANDARGLTRIKGIRNNSRYVIDKKKVYIESLHPIAAGQEILVAYGKEYWQTIKNNLKATRNM